MNQSATSCISARMLSLYARQRLARTPEEQEAVRNEMNAVLGEAIRLLTVLGQMKRMSS